MRFYGIFIVQWSNFLVSLSSSFCIFIDPALYHLKPLSSTQTDDDDVFGFSIDRLFLYVHDDFMLTKPSQSVHQKWPGPFRFCISGVRRIHLITLTKTKHNNKSFLDNQENFEPMEHNPFSMSLIRRSKISLSCP